MKLPMPFVLPAPLRLRMLLFSLTACSALVSVSGLAQSRFDEVDATPYDAQMERVEPVLGMTLGWSGGPISVTTINEWMTGLRAMPYRYSILWKMPAEVEAA